VETLEQCLADQRRIMGDSKGVVQGRRIEEAKLLRKIGSIELETLRGFSLKPESTFHQTNNNNNNYNNNNNNSNGQTLMLPKIKNNFNQLGNTV
jgi:hypothetical protein